MSRSSPVKNPQVGRNVRRIRRQKKISVRAFCAKAKPPIAAAQLLATELGRREPTLEMVQRYAKVLDVDVNTLIAK